MRVLQLFTLTLLAMALPMRADFLFAASDGGDESQVVCCTAGLQLLIDEANWHIIANGYEVVCADVADCSAGLSTGPFIGNTADTWTFAGGGSFFFQGLSGSEYPFPLNFPCVDSPLGGCVGPPGFGGLTGSFTGDANLTLTQNGLSLSGPVLIPLGGLAAYADMAPAITGFLDMGFSSPDFSGSSVQPSTGFDAFSVDANLRVTAGAPEPGSYWLLLSALLFVFLLVRSRLIAPCVGQEKPDQPEGLRRWSQAGTLR
ncbi:MAG TPA: hypothetical protein VNH83_11465 [Bryobacteraceae bacterium]|nr:hypothetical protein [Bryobacteraceae bacterium]